MNGFLDRPDEDEDDGDQFLRPPEDQNNNGRIDTGYAFDPRILYDRHSKRWYASATDNLSVLLAVSNGPDPTQGWLAWRIPESGIDFPTLGINQEGGLHIPLAITKAVGH